MGKKKVGVIFGGVSTEHEVSISSGTSVIENLDKEKYDIYPMYLTKEGNWNVYTKPVKEIKTLELQETITPIKPIENVLTYLKQMDIIFPVLHGKGGEDGTLQGLLEILQIPYVGCGVLSSSVGMDKVYTKIIFEKAHIPQANYCYIQKRKEDYFLIDSQMNETKQQLEDICTKVEEKLTYPMFVKPSNSGSSVGISKVKTKEELKQGIELASKFDIKILVEQGIEAREVECAVLGKEEVIASCIGEILPADEFYSFDAKYSNAESKTQIPADIEKEISNAIRDYAIKAFKAIDAKGLSRVDFFVEKGTNQIYINEINTLPGFTKISMYPKLFEQVGIPYTKLLDKLIQIEIGE